MTEITRPTIVLVGGSMQLEDGSTMDSRQRIDGDPACHVIHTSLAGSLMWWTSTISLVEPLLRSAARQDPYALMIGNRTVLEPRESGMKRTGLAKFLPGGTTDLEVVRAMRNEPFPEGFEELWHDDDHEGTVWSRVGARVGDLQRHWRFLKGSEYYLSRIGVTLDPPVIVDSGESTVSGEEMYTGRYPHLEEYRLFTDRTIIVMPHTRRTESLCRGYLRWVAKGRPAVSYPTPPVWNPDAPPDPVQLTRLIPVAGSFRVTGLVRDGEWTDPGALESARQLLQARYDLKLGIWDLVDNDVLRTSLLAEIPRVTTPRDAVIVPTVASERAARQAEQVVDRRAEQRSALRTITKATRVLEESGWKSNRPDRGFLRTLGLTEPIRRWGNADAWPLAQLDLLVNKRSTSITAFTSLYNLDINICDYVEGLRSRFEEIASPGDVLLRDGRPTIWSARGGWGDELDWDQRSGLIAEMTTQWRAAFVELCERCLSTQAEAEERARASSPIATVYVDIRARLQNGQIVVSTGEQGRPSES